LGVGSFIAPALPDPSLDTVALALPLLLQRREEFLDGGPSGHSRVLPNEILNGPEGVSEIPSPRDLELGGFQLTTCLRDDSLTTLGSRGGRADVLVEQFAQIEPHIEALLVLSLPLLDQRLEPLVELLLRERAYVRRLAIFS